MLRWAQQVWMPPAHVLANVYILLGLVLTIRELGNTFQLMRMPSLSSISPHCSFTASRSMIATEGAL